MPGNGERTDAVGFRALLRPPHRRLVVGVLLLELSSAVSVYVLAVITPQVIGDLDARHQYPLVLSAASVGLFVSLPTAREALRVLGAPALLTASIVLSVVGNAVAALAGGAWTFAAGRFGAAVGAGYLAVLGVSAAIDALPRAHRARLIALIGSMWILPGLVGPPAALALDHAVGWRWTLMAPTPVALLGRAMISAAARRVRPGRRQPFRPASLLLPAGLAVFVLASGGSGMPWAYVGLLVALVGGWATLPAGTFALAPGPPGHLALLGVVSVAFFGLDAMFTTIATRSTGVPLSWAVASLGLAAFAWAIVSLAQPRLAERGARHAAWSLRTGLLLQVLAAAAIAVVTYAGSASGAAYVLCWVVAGSGMGLVYPAMYLEATTPDPLRPELDAAVLGSAVILAEALGTQFGTALGSGVVDLAQQLGLGERAGLHATTVVFAAILAGAAVVGFVLTGARRRLPLP